MRINRQGERARGRGGYPPNTVAVVSAPVRLSAFTLLEIMVALAISAVLMLSLWTLLGTYAKLFTIGQTETVHAQVVRGVFQQLADDLHSAIQDTADSSGSATARRFGLFGSAHTLQIDVLQPPHLRPGSVAAHPLDLLDQSRSGPALELRTVAYTFQDSASSDATQAAAQSGLLRREFDWETPVVPTDALSQQSANSSPATATTGAPPTSLSDGSSPSPDAGTTLPATGGALPDNSNTPAELSFLQQAAINPDDDTVTWIPEIVALEFRYFDGSSWTSTWSSIDHKSLPVAVEVVLQLAPSVAADNTSQPAASQSVAIQPTSDDSSGLGQPNPNSPDSTSPSGPICHLMIHLPAAKIAPAPTLFADDDNNPSATAATPDNSTPDNSSLASTGIDTSDGGLSDPSAEMGADGTIQDSMSLQDLNTIIGADQPPTADASTSPQGSAWPNPITGPSDHWMRVLQ